MIQSSARRWSAAQGVAVWGASILCDAALFDLADYKGEIVPGLFGNERYLESVEAFWAAEEAVIAARVQGYRDVGWKDIALLERGDAFQSWERVPYRIGLTSDSVASRETCQPRNGRSCSPQQIFQHG